MIVEYPIPSIQETKGTDIHEIALIAKHIIDIFPKEIKNVT